MHFADRGRLTEIGRLKAFERIGTKSFDSFTKLAAALCNAPVAYISLLDQEVEHFLARIGIEQLRLPRNLSICGRVIEQDKTCIIHDIPQDGRFRNFPTSVGLPKLKFYAGAPLITSNSIKLGVLCVLDVLPRTLTKEQETSLKILADQIVSKLEDELMRDELNLMVVRLKTLINGINMAIIFEDEHRKIFAINDTAHELFGLRIEHLIGRNVFEFFLKLDHVFKNPDDFVQAALKCSHGSAELRFHDVEMCNGQRLELSYFPIVLEHDVKGYLWVFKDISERKDAERLIEIQKAKLIMASRMAALGEVAAGIAHEINNPLSIIQSIGYILKKVTDESASSMKLVRESGDRLEKTTLRISRIINALLQFARESDSEQIADVRVQDIFEDTLGFVQERFQHSGIQLSVAPFDTNLMIRCSRPSVSQILLNLLSNAFDAASAAIEKWAEIAVLDAGAFVRIAVSDSGKGIPEEVRRKIMQPFFTTKELGKGSGLGLSISSGLAEKMGGRLYLDGRTKHTRFMLELPKAP